MKCSAPVSVVSAGWKVVLLVDIGGANKIKITPVTKTHVTARTHHTYVCVVMNNDTQNMDTGARRDLCKQLARV